VSKKESKKDIPQKDNIKKLFSEFPIIDNDFQAMVPEVVKFQDGENDVYGLILRHMMFNSKGILVAGYAVKTGTYTSSFDEMVQKIKDIVNTGLFSNQNFLSDGTLYDSSFKVLQPIDWGFYLGDRESAELH
jgi:hypothetical protein